MKDPTNVLAFLLNWNIWQSARCEVAINHNLKHALDRCPNLIAVIVGTGVNDNNVEADLRQSGSPRICS